MIRRGLVLTSFLFFSLAANSSSQAEPELPSLPISTHCAFTGIFAQSKTLEGLPSPLSSNGVFYYHCELGVIWKSEQPIAETLIFKKDGKAFAFDEEGQSRAIKSQQGKVLGRLLNDLIGADFAQLAKTFSLEQLNSKAVRFTPRKRRLKRALKMVDLAVTGENNTTVEINIVDRNKALTQVLANQTNILEPLDDLSLLIEQCVLLKLFSSAECSLLIPSDTGLSNN